MYLLLASVNENHEIYMKDSMSAAEVGTGQYATTKGISQTNLITTVTPEKKAEEEHGEEEDRRKKAEEATPVPALRLEGKVQLLAASLSCPHLYKQLSGSETVDWVGGGREGGAFRRQHWPWSCPGLHYY